MSEMLDVAARPTSRSPVPTWYLPRVSAAPRRHSPSHPARPGGGRRAHPQAQGGARRKAAPPRPRASRRADPAGPVAFPPWHDRHDSASPRGGARPRRAEGHPLHEARSLRFTSSRDFQRALERALRRATCRWPSPPASTPTRRALRQRRLDGHRERGGVLRDLGDPARRPRVGRVALDEALPPGIDVLTVVEAAAGRSPTGSKASDWLLEFGGLDVPTLESQSTPCWHATRPRSRA